MICNHRAKASQAWSASKNPPRPWNTPLQKVDATTNGNVLKNFQSWEVGTRLHALSTSNCERTIERENDGMTLCNVLKEFQPWERVTSLHASSANDSERTTQRSYVKVLGRSQSWKRVPCLSTHLVYAVAKSQCNDALKSAHDQPITLLLKNPRISTLHENTRPTCVVADSG